jgi:hypothetical protein
MSNTRTTKPRQTAANRATTARRTTRTAPEPELIDDDQAEMEAQEADATDGYVTVSLAGEPVRVLHAGSWRNSTLRSLRLGDFDAFAQDVLHEDDVEIFDEVDPTQDQLGQFVQDAQALAGSAAGKSSGPRRPSRNTQRR